MRITFIKKLMQWRSALLLFYTLLFFSCSMKNEHGSARSEIVFDDDWKFSLGNYQGAEEEFFDDKEWRTISLPHDWSIEDIGDSQSPLDPKAIGSTNTGFFVGGIGWYRKYFSIPDSSADQKVKVYFEGVYMNSDVWINGHHLGNHPYGYTSFEYDLTPHLRFDQKNVIAVEVKNEGKNSRWYSGSGIYRHVKLKVLNKIHFQTWGIVINTPKVSKEKSTVSVNTRISGYDPQNSKMEVAISIIDAKGIEMAKSQSKLTSDTINLDLDMVNCSLWSLDNPALYSAIVSLIDEGELIDKVTQKFGLRTIDFSTDEGFLLNGKSVLLKGGCMHHDNGPLGAAAYDRGDESRVELMKKNGFNAIRCAHNPPSEAFLNACDKFGVLVIDEAFDQWNEMKWNHKDDYSKYFQKWWKADLHAMVKRDINHPSIIMWSTGNEIPERAEAKGIATSEMLANEIKSIDKSRPVTAAVHGLNPDKDPFFKTLDISGVNYSIGGDHGIDDIYKLDHERVPDRIMYCSESYPFHAYGSWKAVEKYPFVIGDFVWTSFDYLGESSLGWLGYMPDSSFYPWSHAFCGDLDICGFKRPQSYYRDVIWNQEKNPVSIWVHPQDSTFERSNPNHEDWSKWHWDAVLANWNWEGNEGLDYQVDVYNASDAVELFLNDQSLGRKVTNESNEMIATWTVPYKPGQLKAIAYQNNQEVNRAMLKTASKVTQIVLEADKDTLKSKTKDLSYISVYAQDELGVRNPNSQHLVSYSIKGPAEIIAVGSSNPKSTESFKQSKRRLFEGRGLVIIKLLDEQGLVQLTANSDGLASSSIDIYVE
ncbi:MAG: DUF4982 domain-containing protein [Cyclobacteriaceae bacterium]